MTASRIGSLSLVTDVLRDVSSSQLKLADLQNQISSGYKSQDFAGLNGSVEQFTQVESQINRATQFNRNNQLNIAKLQTADVALGKITDIADKIKKARNIGVKSLNLRLNVKNSHDELGQLALTFNEMLERIEHSFRTHQQFIRNASHEIRTPLTAITTEADLALQGNRSVEYQREALQNIRLQAEHLGDLVAQLLLMAKVEAPGTLNDEPCATDEILLNAIQAIQIKYSLGRQAIQLQIDAADASQLLVRCDPVILQAAFSNLLDNAIKYGSNQPVSVRLFALDRWVRLEVEDQGMGITPEDLEQIFIPFYRSRQNKHFSGSGIGLSLVKNIAEKYGGTIHVQSNWGSGTLVQFDLPR